MSKYTEMLEKENRIEKLARLVPKTEKKNIADIVLSELSKQTGHDIESISLIYHLTERYITNGSENLWVELVSLSILTGSKRLCVYTEVPLYIEIGSLKSKQARTLEKEIAQILLKECYEKDILTKINNEVEEYYN